jgi:sec-independent protein translocase protein TatB
MCAAAQKGHTLDGMFDIGPEKLILLIVVGLIVLGPDKLPGLARDAARMLRTLRELATGAQTQLKEELGPDFADLDLHQLNPRVAMSRILLGEDADPVTRLDVRTTNQPVHSAETQSQIIETSVEQPKVVNPDQHTPSRLVPEQPAFDPDAT